MFCPCLTERNIFQMTWRLWTFCKSNFIVNECIHRNMQALFPQSVSGPVPKEFVYKYLLKLKMCMCVGHAHSCAHTHRDRERDNMDSLPEQRVAMSFLTNFSATLPGFQVWSTDRQHLTPEFVRIEGSQTPPQTSCSKIYILIRTQVILMHIKI